MMESAGDKDVAAALSSQQVQILQIFDLNFKGPVIQVPPPPPYPSKPTAFKYAIVYRCFDIHHSLLILDYFGYVMEFSYEFYKNSDKKFCLYFYCTYIVLTLYFAMNPSFKLINL